MLLKRIITALFFSWILLNPVLHAEEDLPQMDESLDHVQTTLPAVPADSSKHPGLLAKGVGLKMLPLPADLAIADFACLPGTLFTAEQQYNGELPVGKETLLQPRTGVFFAAPQIVFVLFKSTADAKGFDLLLIDSNGDGNLGDEKVHARKKSNDGIPLKINLNGNNAEMAFYFPQESTEVGVPSAGPRLCPPTMPQGTVNIGGQNIRCALFNGAPGMEYKMGNVVVFLDLNNDGKYNLQWDNPLAIEGFQLAPLMYAKNKFLQSAVSADGMRFYLGDYSGATGNIDITLLPTAKPMVKLYVLSLLPDGGNSSDILRIITDKLPAPTPLGKYALLDASVYGETNRVLLSFAYPDFSLTTQGMSFPANRVDMKANALLDGNVLKVNQKTTGPGEVLFNLVGPATENDPGPLVEVFINAPVGKPVMSGHMEYG